MLGDEGNVILFGVSVIYCLGEPLSTPDLPVFLLRCQKCASGTTRLPT